MRSYHLVLETVFKILEQLESLCVGSENFLYMFIEVGNNIVSESIEEKNFV